jgi:hypothetical protein
MTLVMYSHYQVYKNYVCGNTSSTDLPLVIQLQYMCNCCPVDQPDCQLIHHSKLCSSNKVALIYYFPFNAQPTHHWPPCQPSSHDGVRLEVSCRGQASTAPIICAPPYYVAN